MTTYFLHTLCSILIRRTSPALGGDEAVRAGEWLNHPKVKHTCIHAWAGRLCRAEVTTA